MAADLRTILVTGGAGFIGSHTCVDLLEAGHDVVVVDNLVNSSKVALERVEALTGRRPAFVEADLREEDRLAAVMDEHQVGAVVHFAGLKAVGESVEQPLDYYENNVAGTLSLLRAMQRQGVPRIVFSSSAAVYGLAEDNPVDESAPVGPTNPYARTKLMIEEILTDVCAASPEWSATSLRYFNPIGAHASGQIGEDPQGYPNNLMPFVMQVASGRRERLQVFGDDYDTIDGTGVRDYIHVVDLAEGHRRALEHIDDATGHRVYNLGTGRGSSVLELVAAVEQVIGRPVPRDIVARRPGDVDALVADPARARAELGWTATRGIEEMCADSWRFQSANPQGYDA
jgi:UDP-glucose 4-epimerase